MQSLKRIKMTEKDFKIVFDSGSHDIDIETLIGNLMHTSNLIQEVNRYLQTDKKIEVKIKALEKGSFEVHIELIEKLIDSLFSNNSVSYTANIIAIVGGLYGLVSFLKGKKPKKIEPENDKIKITNNSGNVTYIEGNVYHIYNENKIVRDTISKQFSVLEKNDDITGFKFENQTENIYIPSEDFEKVAIKLDELDNQSQNPIFEIVTDKMILIIRPSFSKDLKWDFVYENQKISAKMEDEEMIKIIDNGEQFAKGDHMLVDLEITKFYDKDLNTYLITKDSYKILKYKQHIKSPRQLSIFTQSE